MTGLDGSLELLLLRHAKSAWDQPEVADHERELSPHGKKAAERIGRELRTRGLAPDLALCSTARRAVRTWELVAGAFDAQPPCRYLRSLYLAPPGQMLGLVRRQSASARRLLLVGHDPGLHSLANRLTGDGPEHERRALEAKLPTGAIVHLAFAVAAWEDVGDAAGRLLAFLRPRDLAP